ncbi:MAG: sugar ABC transporter permease [Chloroflexi bacterium]|nr:sugar ABC transporter permease [Chloroflexota bacterium]
MVGEVGFRKWGWVAFFLAPSLIGLLVFVLGPILSSLGLTLFDWNLLSDPKFIKFDNFKELYHDKDFWIAFKHTLMFITYYIPSVLVTALITALLLNQRLRGVSVFRTAFFVPVVASWVVVAVIWKWIFNPRFGLLNFLLAKLGIEGPAWLFDPDTALYAIIITSVWKDTGFVAVMLLAGLQNIPETYYEAAKIDGARPWQRLRFITLPLLTPSIFFALIISLINSFQVFEQAWLMPERFARSGTTVVVEQIVNNAFRYSRMGYAATMSWVLFVVIFAITFVQIRLQKRWVNYDL